MDSKPHIALNALLSRGGRELEPILTHANHVNHWARRFREMIDETMAKHCRVANLREGCLVIQADSAAWATRFNFMMPSLLSSLKDDDSPVKTMKCYIRPRGEEFGDEPVAFKLSTKSSKLLKQTAATVGDKKLREVLERLASRTD